MPLSHVRKRNGALVEFDIHRIRSAVLRAFEATGLGPADAASAADQIAESAKARLDQLAGFAGSTGSTEATVLADTTSSLAGLAKVEDIQELVETLLMEFGHFETAKRYIRYRYGRGQARDLEREETRKRADQGDFSVRNTAGAPKVFQAKDLEAYLEVQRGLLPTELAAEVDPRRIVDRVLPDVHEGISTLELRKLSIAAAAGLIEEEPAYDEYAALLLRQVRMKEMAGLEEGEAGFDGTYRRLFVDGIHHGLEAGYLDAEMIRFDLDRLAAGLDPARDREVRYIGSETLFERYLLRLDNKLVETIQGFWMRVSMGLALREEQPEERALEFYDAMSGLRFIPSTPSLFHAGTTHPQLSSCYLSTVKDDLAHIFKLMGDNAALSKWSGGIGNDWTNIRGTGAYIKSTKVSSQGVIPFLKIANDVTVAINRSGKRRGATCAYLETWHYDIEDFLDLRRNTGDDRRRTHDMNTANWVPDLFMERVLARGSWTLFSPDECPDLHELTGKAFRERYEFYEAQAAAGQIKLFRSIDAVKLWRKMLTRLFETGHPWITFKDPSNLRSPQDHVGVVHNSNLCTEITLNTSPEETAVCNLGSVNLAKHFDPNGIGLLDRERIAATVQTAIRMLDNVIDINFYPTPEAKTSNFHHRPIGLGIMGFQDLLFMGNLSFTDPRAAEVADSSMELISYHAILASSRLAAERGTYHSYPGSKWDRGILPVDTLDILEAERGRKIPISREAVLDWTELRQHLARHGMRNSNTMAVAPTATISNIAGTYPCIEPAYKNLYVKSNMSGEFTVINRYLVRDLKALGLWNRDLLEQIKFHDGSIRKIEAIPQELRDLYLEAFEIDPLNLLLCTARRGKWIDQSQSHNVFMQGTSGTQLDRIYTAAWELGLKTSYYLRSLAASQIEKSTLDAKKYGFTQKREKGEALGAGGSAEDRGAADRTVTVLDAMAEGQLPEPLLAAAPRGTAAELNTALLSAARTGEQYGRSKVAFETLDMANQPATSQNICSLLDPDCEACQ